ncbi:MAG: DRTGG domain-containing protein [Pseudoflavonifractor sp.]
MTVADLQAALSLTAFALPVPGVPVTGGYAGDLLSWVMGRAHAGDCWITIMSNQNVAAVALMADTACVVLSEGVTPDEGLIARCNQQGINLLGSEKSTYSLAGELGQLIIRNAGQEPAL